MLRWRVMFLGLIAASSYVVSSMSETPVIAAADGGALRGSQHGPQETRRLGEGCKLNELNFWEMEDRDRALGLQVSLPLLGGLLTMSGFFTMLTLGLTGMDTIGLEIVAKGDDPDLARCARKIITLRKNPNQLMCTLMLGNIGCNACLAILAADALSISWGLAIAIILTLVFGEMVPQAMLSGHTLRIGAKMVPIARILMVLLYVFTKPMSLMLTTSGREMGAVRTRTELIERLQVMSEQHQQAAMVAADETARKVAAGALQFRNRMVQDVMTPLEDAYMLPSSTRLGYTAIRQIFETGFTRIPVYGKTKNEYLGLLVTKDLMLADPEDEMKLGDFITIFDRKVQTVYLDTKLVEVLNLFKIGGTHMGLVQEVNIEVDTNPHFEIRGVVTLEDVIEEILQDEIVDETDVYKDVDRQVKVLDGRETRVLNLAVFNPLWRSRKEQLSPEEVGTISSHLERMCFGRGSSLHLSIKAVEWLVSKCGVQNRSRVTPHGTEEIEEEDLIYEIGREADKCTLIVQGRLAIRAGKDLFRSEVGAFSVLGQDALRPGHICISDYRAFLSTNTVRLVHITKVSFLEALVLDRHPKALEEASAKLAAEAAGEGGCMSAAGPMTRGISPQSGDYSWPVTPDAVHLMSIVPLQL